MQSEEGKVMKPMSPIIPGVELPETVYGAGQSEYEPLPAWKGEDGTVLTRWRLSWRERLRVLWIGDVYLFSLTFNSPLQPVMLQVETPVVTQGEK